MTFKLEIISLCLLLSVVYFTGYECYIKKMSSMGNLQSKDGAGTEDIEVEEVDEWDRYIKFNRQRVKNILKDKKQSRKSKTNYDKKVVAPSFVLSRTRAGIIVKQHELGSKFKSKGGFEFPEKPMLLTNVQYKYDGSISPVIKLSETDKGVVSKKLEYGKAKSPGLNWDTRSGSARFKIGGRSRPLISESGEVNKNAGLHKDFRDGSISIRGTFELNINNATGVMVFEPVEPLPEDSSYSNEETEYKGDGRSFETDDMSYEENGEGEDNGYQDEYGEDSGDNKYDSGYEYND